MPTILIEGYKFRFYAQDRDEPPHMHVLRGEDDAKVWLYPVELECAYGYNSREVNRILDLTRQHQDELLEAWYGYFGR
jgi:hypothetical protein